MPSRKLLATLMSGIILVVALTAMQSREPQTQQFRITFGLKDTKPTEWNADVEVTEGKITALSGWRFENKDKIQGTRGWKCQTKEFIAPQKRWPVQLANGKPRAETEQTIWPNGVDLQVLGSKADILVKFKQGEVKFKSDQVKLGQPLTFLDGQVRIERMPATSILRPAAKPKAINPPQDDYPAFWVDEKTGKHFLAWVCYQNEGDRILLTEREGPHGTWSTPKVVAAKGQHFRVSLAGTKRGTIWITWASQKNNNWDLYTRPLSDGRLGATQRLTNDPGPDIWHRMTMDRQGRAWLVWQGFRNGQSDIFARCAEGQKWFPARKISRSSGNAWDPCITADSKSDKVWIGWDSYEQGNYRVLVTALSGGPDAKEYPTMMPEPCNLFQAHLCLACDPQGRLWAAWDESGPQWGKDTGFLFGGEKRQDTSRLYSSRTIRVRCYADGKWLDPKGEFENCLPVDMKEYNEYPQLQADRQGRIWLAFRHRTCRRPREDGWAAQGRWDLFASSYDGEKWLEPIPLPQSGGRNDMRTASHIDAAGNVYFAYASDNRGWFPPAMLPRNHHVAISQLRGDGAVKKMTLVQRKRNYPIVADCHPREKEQVARIRKYKIEAGGKTYHIYRGDLHRHTDISSDGVGDGSITDLHRYALDAVAFDYILVGDHNMGQDNEYCWWTTQQANDLYTVPGAFISMYGYERSVPYPNGHRNVIWTERGHRTLPLPKPIPAQRKNDTPKLYDYLRQTGGICTLHTSATSQGTDWADEHDPKLEPFVEIFQGYHTSYEALNAPMAIDDKTMRIHGKYEPAGFVSKALDKGYRLGFQASSDHISTHVSYACILAEEFSRKGLVEAMKKRHSYAATDNIILDVRMGSHMQGDEVVSREPRLDVVVLGTGPIDKVEVIRDNKVIHTVRPENHAEEVRFRWQDPHPGRGQGVHYYYVRVMQRDSQMAWSSPIWVRNP